MCVIPLIVMFKDYDKYLNYLGYDLFEDVIDTSFYHTDNLQQKIPYIQGNFKIIENNLTIEGRFKDDIWKRAKKINQFYLWLGKVFLEERYKEL